MNLVTLVPFFPRSPSCVSSRLPAFLQIRLIYTQLEHTVITEQRQSIQYTLFRQICAPVAPGQDHLPSFNLPTPAHTQSHHDFTRNERRWYVHHNITTTQPTTHTNLPIPVGCTPSSISPATWIPGFSDHREVYSCAIAANSTTIVDKLKENCCSGAVQEWAGCYHWCEPKDKDWALEDWAACVSDHVYFDTDFGQSCNAMGGLETKSAHSQNQEPMADAGSSAAAVTGVSAGWKVGVLVGLVGLVQVLV